MCTERAVEGIWYRQTRVLCTERAAEIAGILFNDKNETVIAFRKLKSTDMLCANTPYVVRFNPDEEGTPSKFCFVAEDADLKATAASAFTVQSAYDNFTFTGNYEWQHIDDAYSLNGEGVFQKMGATAKLRPMRFALTIEKRSDCPYPISTGGVDICPCATLLSGSLWDKDNTSGLNEEPGGEEDFL